MEVSEHEANDPRKRRIPTMAKTVMRPRTMVRILKTAGIAPMSASMTTRIPN